MDQTQKIKISLNTAYISGIFTALVALLMLFNYVQIKSNTPLETKSMEVLVERLQNEPNNEELKQEIRNLDLLARKAYFTNQWQINTGKYLLLFGAIVCIVSLRYYYSLTFKREKPKRQSSDEEKKRMITLRWIAATGGFLFLIAFLSSFAVVNHLKIYKTGDTGESTVAKSQEEIEVIDVTEGSEVEQTVETTVATDEQNTRSVAESPVKPARKPKQRLNNQK